jgi:PAP2 superfamily
MKKILLYFLLYILFCNHAVAQSKTNDGADTHLFTENVFHLSEIMLHDVANPPAAGRFYAYAMLGAYETLTAADNKTSLLGKVINQKLLVSRPAPPKELNKTFCSIYAMLEVGKNLMPSGPMLQGNQDTLISHFNALGYSTKSLQKQIRFAKAIADQVISYARTDGYNKLSTYSRYVSKKQDGYWFPTPPEYMGAVEPNWSTVRSFFLDSAKQFAPPPPVPFSREIDSPFYVLTKEVYNVSTTLTEEQREIANFWDCNPFAVTYSGHMAIGLKKISPGGHWMGITGIASDQAKLPIESTVLIHAVVAMTLHDAFVSCWHEKYTSHRIRPEAAINKFLDPKWRPLLQTPPFPEYTSGHSVLSSAVAVILTNFFGDNFSFTDTSEEYFGLPSRKFNSFTQAAQEAAISRLYGGIHYRDACENGVIQGNLIGTHIIKNKLNLSLIK